MQKEGEKKLVTYTALAIVAETDTQQIQSIREKLDPAYERWPPHINLYFPFIVPEQFDAFYQGLTHELSEIKQFQITFSQLDFFPHGVIYLKPDTANKEILQIHKIISTKYPQLDGKKQFHPHMTIANKIKKHEVQNLKNELQNKWNQWKIKCTGLHFLHRGKQTPFKTLKFLKFSKDQ